MIIYQKLVQRNITQEDVLETLLNGEIIEEYEDDYPYPSCLVCGSNKEELWIITAYYPNNTEWEDNWKKRKEKK